MKALMPVSAGPAPIDRFLSLFRRPAKVTAGKDVRILGPNRSRGDNARNVAALARYEAGNLTSRNRTWLPEYVQDARQDITPGERLEMVRKSRYFEKNNAYYQKLLDLIEVNVVGNGIHPTPASKNKGWNKRALARWEQWCQFADLTSRQSFYTLQAIIARTQAVDGEIFIRLTYGDPDGSDIAWPRIQLIETHRVCDAQLPRQYAAEGFASYDGIVFDGRGRPVYYIVSQDADAFDRYKPSSVVLLPAEEVVHVFEPGRSMQPRGIPLCHAVLHDLHDLDDLQNFEMLASKKAAVTTHVIKTATGEAPESDLQIGTPETVVNADGSTEEKIVYYKQELGGETVVLKHGDSYEQSDALRPTAAQTEHWDRILKKFCWGTGISYGAMTDFAGAWGGAALRAALVADNRFYDVRSKTLVAPLQRIWEHVIGNDPELKSNRPDDWRRVAWQSPRRGTVDIGRESKAIIDELEKGIRTERELMSELGLDYNEVRNQRKIEVGQRLADAKALAKEHDIPLLTALSLLQRLPQGVSASAPAQPSAPEPDPDDMDELETEQLRKAQEADKRNREATKQ